MSQLKNKTFNLDYTTLISKWGYVEYDLPKQKETLTWEKGFFNEFFWWIFWNVQKSDEKEVKLDPSEQAKIDAEKWRDPIQEQLREIIRMPDDKYSDKLLTSNWEILLRSMRGDNSSWLVTPMAPKISATPLMVWEIHSLNPIP
jgi:hypothetical protein